MNRGMLTTSCLNTESDSLLFSKTYRKSRKRKRRNKLKNSESNKFRNKWKNNNFTGTAKNPSVSEIQTFTGEGLMSTAHSKKMMSNWFWKNYNTTIEWRNKHKVAYWKSYALALKQENEYLLKVIQDIDPQRGLPIIPSWNEEYHSEVKQKYRTKVRIEASLKKKQTNENSCINNYGIDEDEDIAEDETIDEDDGNEEFSYEMSEEMLQFFEQSFKHKMDLKKSKEKTRSQTDEINDQLKKTQQERIQRAEEMKLLYGDGVSMIVGMETAVQLSFERHCDMKSPKYWPNIPLKL